MLEKMIPDAVEVEGNDSDEFKEETFQAFSAGQIRVLVSKPVIAGFGLNWQHCAHQTFFPSHSFEQWYQAIRRSWRFGQDKPVRVDVIASEGERGVLSNMNRKAHQAEQMFSRLVELINNELRIEKKSEATKPTQIPSWL
jgi:SNF2 family DNA or RNA helicase